MKKYISAYCFAVTLMSSLLSHAADNKELSLGLFPYVTSTQLVQFHSPLKSYLSQTLGIDVNLVTAPDFESFMERTQKGEYDIILTAPHLGRLAEKRDGYQRLAMTKHNVEGVFLAKKDSEINSLDDLKDKKIMVAQRVSVIYQMALHTLANKGLVNGKNLTIIETKTHNNALYAPLRDEADASVTGIVLWQTLGQEFKDQLKVIGYTSKVPGFVFLSHPKIPVKMKQKLQKALFDFEKTVNGKAYIETSRFIGFQLIDDKTMKELDPYIRIFSDKP